jgi:xanthine dehydrogenase accessory factor
MMLDRVHVPVGLDLGHTSHREIAVAVLAQLVQLRATGGLRAAAAPAPTPEPAVSSAIVTALDPVCGMTVTADASGRPVEHDGVTYYFCCVGCRDAFVTSPGKFVSAGSAGTV